LKNIHSLEIQTQLNTLTPQANNTGAVGSRLMISWVLKQIRE